jgi:hypothetical protein
MSIDRYLIRHLLHKQAHLAVLAHYGFKLAVEPASNVSRDQGTYRFNGTAQENDIADSKMYVFKAHDRKPDPDATHSESGQGATFQEGVSG